MTGLENWRIWRIFFNRFLRLPLAKSRPRLASPSLNAWHRFQMPGDKLSFVLPPIKLCIYPLIVNFHICHPAGTCRQTKILHEISVFKLYENSMNSWRIMVFHTQLIHPKQWTAVQPRSSIFRLSQRSAVRVSDVCARAFGALVNRQTQGPISSWLVVTGTWMDYFPTYWE